jgi:hypothetical protein
MQDFAALKQEEEKILDSQLQARQNALHRIESFNAKRAGLTTEISSITSEPSAQSAHRLRTEANVIEVEIKELEGRLFEMKARHRHLVDEAQRVENSVQSKLSSYNASLELLEKEISGFLARPPVEQSIATAISSPRDDGARSRGTLSETASFHSLHPKRRTLDMATEHWQQEAQELQRRKAEIEREKTALEEGSTLWREVVAEIQSAEKEIKSQMSKLSSSPPFSSMPPQESDAGIEGVLMKMDHTIDMLAGQLKLAEEKDWKLLICAIGAEWEAFREGREMWIEACGLQLNHDRLQDPETQNGLVDFADEDREGGTPDLDSPGETFLRQPSLSADDEDAADGEEASGSVILSKRPDGQEVGDQELLSGLARTDSRSESEDEDPGPDFLISHT